jgi:acylglycerol lipase
LTNLVGYAEHIERYNHVFSRIAAANIDVFGFDGRGFGRSATKVTAGVTGGWSVQLNDIDYFITQERARRPDLPLFLWGHSMGGALVLKYGIDGAHKDELAGIISMAPLIDQHPSSRANSLLAKIGSMAAVLLPDKQISVQVSSQNISRDPIEREKYDKDELVRPFGSLRGVADMLNGGPTLLSTDNASKLGLPLLLLHGTADKVTYHKSSAEFFELVQSSDKTFLEYPGYFHE